MIPALRSLVLGLAAAVVLAGCPQPTPPPPPPPPVAPEIVAFSASASSVNAGETVTLSWETRHADVVEVRDLALGLVSGASGASGQVEVTVTESTVYVLSAKNARGLRESAAVTISVIEGALDVLFAATPASVPAGESAVLAWIADGAKEVSLRVKGGADVDLGDQTSAGWVKVTPEARTTWELAVDGRTYEATIDVKPVIHLLTATPSWVAPGEEVTLQWLTQGATRITVEAVGRGEVHEETAPGEVAEGSFTELVSETVDPADVVSYVVTAHGASGAAATARLELYVAGDPVVESFTGPQWANENLTFPLSWKTLGADEVEITADGVPFFRSQTPGQAVQGTLEVATPAAATTYRLAAIYLRGGTAWSDEVVVTPVSAPVLVNFSASPQPGIQTGGDAVTLTWNVTNAQNVRIEVVGGPLLHQQTGAQSATGTLDAYPNADVTYRLTADNGAGLSIPPQTVAVTVQDPATLVFNPTEVPAGAQVQITGTNPTLSGAMRSWQLVRKNEPQDAFEDILGTGTALPVASGDGDDAVSYLITLPGPFSTRVMGTPVTSSTVNVSINGWMSFSPATVIGPLAPGNTLPQTALPHLTIAPYAEDLQADTSTRVLWRLDGAGAQQRLIVQWDEVMLWDQPGKRLTFQAQIYPSGKILFAYKSLVGLAATDVPAIGLQNQSSTQAMVPAAGMFTNSQPASGDRISFGGEVTLPQTITASTAPFELEVEVAPGTWMAISGAPVIMPAGQFSVTEVNYNPTAGQEQWIEVRNNTGTARDLGGWDLQFGGGSTHTIAGPLVLPPNGLLLLGPSANAAEGAAVDYVYPATFTLPAAAGSFSVGISGGAYATLAWSAGGVAGSSVQIGAPDPTISLASGVTQLLCPGFAPYGASGQKGTPGAPNTTCVPYVKQAAAPNGFEPIAATGTLVGTMTGAGSDSAIAAISLPRPVTLFGVPVSTLHVSSNGFVSTVATSDSATLNNTTVATSNPNGVLAPFWDDLIGQAGGSVRWQQFDPDTTPGSGDEYTLVSWEGWKIWTSSAGVNTLNFQIRFLEATGDIEFHYGAMSSSDAGGALASGSSATTWLENAAGTAALVHNVNSATNPGISPNTGIRFAFSP